MTPLLLCIAYQVYRGLARKRDMGECKGTSRRWRSAIRVIRCSAPARAHCT